jgi:hypothetical protein
MTLLEQAARQALEALEQHLTHHEHGCVYLDPAVTALREALENHESAYQRGYLDGMAKPCIDCADRKLQAFKQPKQEPAAWMDLHEELGQLRWIGNDAGWDCAINAVKKRLEELALYTAPPKREWVGLTDEEIKQGFQESWVTEQAWQSAVWWAEQKLKEKNA